MTTTVKLDPKAGEVLMIKATGICHTDSSHSGADPGAFPAILGHEGAGVVVDVGAGVTSVKGDHVIPLYIPECRECPRACRARPTCAPRSAPRRAKASCRTAPRFSIEGKTLHHSMGTHLRESSTLPEIAIAKSARTPLRQGLLHRLRRHYRHRRGAQHCQGRARRQGDRVRPGGIGLNVIQAAPRRRRRGRRPQQRRRRANASA